MDFCNLMDFPIHIDTISMWLPIVYFKGSQVEFSNLWCISVPEGSFYHSKQCIMLHFIWIFAVGSSTRLGVSSLQGLKDMLLIRSTLKPFSTLSNQTDIMHRPLIIFLPVQKFNFVYYVFAYWVIFSSFGGVCRLLKINNFKKKFRNTIRMSNGLDSGQLVLI